MSKELFLGLLRNLKLLFIAALIPFLSKTDGERKKVAIYNNLRRTLVGLSVHIIPFAACTTLIVLNLKTYYVGKDVSTTSLQFLAKLLELLTQASISNMALVYLRWLYLGRGPVPFGTLFAGLQITSLNYLWSLEFLGSASSNCLNGKRKLVFMGFIICNLMLAAAVGPSIAVCLIPKRQFFLTETTSIWASSDHETAFPGSLSDSNTQCSTGDTLPACLWDACPAILQASFKNDGRFPLLLPLSYDTSITIQLTTLSLWDLQSDSALASGLQSSIFRRVNNDKMVEAAQLVTMPTISTFLLLSYAINGPSSLRNNLWSIQVEYQTSQPMVGVVCNKLEWPVSNISIVLQNAFDPENSTISLNTHELPRHGQNSTSWTITWFDAPESAPQVSLIAVVFPPAQLLGKPMVDKPKLVHGFVDDIFQAEVCSFAAGWAESRVMAEIGADLIGAIITTNITKAPEKVVKISKHWASSLMDGWKSPEGKSALDFFMPGILAQGHYGSTTFLANIVAYAMSAALPDGWSSWIVFNEDEEYEKLMENSLTPVKDHLRLDFHIYYEGLVYSPYGLPAIVSLIILLIYCLYVVIYTTIMFIKPLSSSAWDSIAELTALAILSAPTEKLRNTSAGIELLNTFREPVSIRAVESDHLEIVFQNDQQERAVDMVQRNKEY